MRVAQWCLLSRRVSRGFNTPYYLRAVEDVMSRASARSRPHATARGVVVEYMGGAQGPTVGFFAQTLRGVRYIAEITSTLRGLGEVRFRRASDGFSVHADAWPSGCCCRRSRA